MKKLFILALAAIVTVFMTGCPKAQKAANRLEAIKAAGKIVVYTNPEFPPYEYLGPNQEIVGSEIDIVKRIAAEIGVKAEIVSAEFDSIIGTVTTGKADLGASGFTINDERKKMVDFSDPFVRSVQYLIIAETSPVKTIEDLAGKKIGGQNGTTGFMMVEDAVNKGILKDTGTSVLSYNNAPDAMVSMAAGQLDAVVIDELVAISLARKNAGFKAIPMVKQDGNGLDEPEEFGMIVAKGEKELLAVVNKVIAEMRADGSLEESTLKHNDLAAGL